ARGIQFWGGQTARSNSVTVKGNQVGNPISNDVDGVYAIGIAVQGSSNILITENTVYSESYVSRAISGIELGPESLTNSFGTVTVEKNKVLKVKSNSGASYGAYGINISSGHGHVIRNNFISGVINSQRGAGGLALTSAPVGIRLSEGNNHRVLHNSVHLYGTIAPGASAVNISAAIGIAGTGQTGIWIINNILSNQISSNVNTLTYQLIFQLPYTIPNADRNVLINNNAYYLGTNPNMFLAKIGTIDPPTSNQIYDLDDFNASVTTPAANFRNYTSQIGNTSNDNASFATTNAPPFVSDSDLHIPTAYNTQLESGGANVSVLDDIDGDVRTTTPDIGADEITAPSSAPAILSGRVLSSGMRGLNGARITVMGGNLLQPRTVIVNGFGYYRFEQLEAGQTYIVSVSARGAVFADPIRVINLDTDLTGLDFYALP
ncbi:MAG: carboxypeptidase regulatory-like domain-containing protein, partial [Acidobacteria bacterium]|nr:carboxypeptidase regulatory-like domain-containing protein [Acidobacteriota bacterium]